MMAKEMPLLIIPIENQVRELDGKLLLACVAAMRGYPSMIGPREELHSRIASFPKSVYIAKGLAGRSALLFKIVRKSGHKIVTWDEEALVHLPPEIYFSRRISPEAIKYVSHLFAWGEDNAELWRQYPDLPAGMPIHITGNPRADLLRKELRSFFDREAEQLRQEFGNFILINTNFNHVNAFYPYKNLFKPVTKKGQEPEFGEAGQGMTREYAEGLRDHKQAVLNDFKKLIPALEEAFPDCNIVLRPHPTENQKTYQIIANRCRRLQVTNDGNVVPWLMATKAVIHNGCTTGVEAYLLGVPAVSYRATVSEYYDLGFYRLPNTLSHQCHSFEELRNITHRILAGELGVADGNARKKMIGHYLASQGGPLACERIMDVVEGIVNDSSDLPGQSVRHRFNRWYLATGLGFIRRLDPYLPGSNNRLEFHRHRYPGISVTEVRSRISRFQQLLDSTRPLNIEQIFDETYRVSA